MTPKFFAFLWILFFVSAGTLWMADVFTLTTAIVFGFIAFGLVFAGMMCVLPGVVSHPPIRTAKGHSPKALPNSRFDPLKVPTGSRLQAGLR